MSCTNRWALQDLPPEFDKWNTVFKRFRDGVKADVFQNLFDAVSDQPDMEYVILDATIAGTGLPSGDCTKGSSSSALGGIWRSTSGGT